MKATAGESGDGGRNGGEGQGSGEPETSGHSTHSPGPGAALCTIGKETGHRRLVYQPNICLRTFQCVISPSVKLGKIGTQIVSLDLLFFFLKVIFVSPATNWHLT